MSFDPEHFGKPVRASAITNFAILFFWVHKTAIGAKVGGREFFMQKICTSCLNALILCLLMPSMFRRQLYARPWRIGVLKVLVLVILVAQAFSVTTSNDDTVPISSRAHPGRRADVSKLLKQAANNRVLPLSPKPLSKAHKAILGLTFVTTALLQLDFYLRKSLIHSSLKTLSISIYVLVTVVLIIRTMMGHSPRQGFYYFIVLAGGSTFATVTINYAWRFIAPANLRDIFISRPADDTPFTPKRVRNAKALPKFPSLQSILGKKYNEDIMTAASVTTFLKEAQKVCKTTASKGPLTEDEKTQLLNKLVELSQLIADGKAKRVVLDAPLYALLGSLSPLSLDLGTDGESIFKAVLDKYSDVNPTTDAGNDVSAALKVMKAAAITLNNVLKDDTKNLSDVLRAYKTLRAALLALNFDDLSGDDHASSRTFIKGTIKNFYDYLERQLETAAPGEPLDPLWSSLADELAVDTFVSLRIDVTPPQNPGDLYFAGILRMIKDHQFSCTASAALKRLPDVKSEEVEVVFGHFCDLMSILPGDISLESLCQPGQKDDALAKSIRSKLGELASLVSSKVHDICSSTPIDDGAEPAVALLRRYEQLVASFEGVRNDRIDGTSNLTFGPEIDRLKEFIASKLVNTTKSLLEAEEEDVHREKLTEVLEIQFDDGSPMEDIISAVREIYSCLHPFFDDSKYDDPKNPINALKDKAKSILEKANGIISTYITREGLDSWDDSWFDRSGNDEKARKISNCKKLLEIEKLIKTAHSEMQGTIFKDHLDSIKGMLGSSPKIMQATKDKGLAEQILDAVETPRPSSLLDGKGIVDLFQKWVSPIELTKTLEDYCTSYSPYKEPAIRLEKEIQSLDDDILEELKNYTLSHDLQASRDGDALLLEGFSTLQKLYDSLSGLKMERLSRDAAIKGNPVFPKSVEFIEKILQTMPLTKLLLKSDKLQKRLVKANSIVSTNPAKAMKSFFDSWKEFRRKMASLDNSPGAAVYDRQEIVAAFKELRQNLEKKSQELANLPVNLSSIDADVALLTKFVQQFPVDLFDPAECPLDSDIGGSTFDPVFAGKSKKVSNRLDILKLAQAIKTSIESMTESKVKSALNGANFVTDIAAIFAPLGTGNLASFLSNNDDPLLPAYKAMKSKIDDMCKWINDAVHVECVRAPKGTAADSPEVNDVVETATKLLTVIEKVSSKGLNGDATKPLFHDAVLYLKDVQANPIVT